MPAQTFQPRPIRHALFKNLSQPDAVARLEGKGEDGAWLFRPHPRGVHLLHLTIRLAADCYLHMEIREGSKVCHCATTPEGDEAPGKNRPP